MRQKVTGLRLERQRHWWLFSTWNVYAMYSGVDWRGEYGGERLVGSGFLTRKAAREWMSIAWKVYGRRSDEGIDRTNRR